MELHKRDNEEFNYPANLWPLFSALSAGKVIKEIVFIPRVRETGRKRITNFEARDYFVAMQSNGDGTEKFDYVSGASEEAEFNGEVVDTSFYMNWVQSYEIGDQPDLLSYTEMLGERIMNWLERSLTFDNGLKRIPTEEDFDTFGHNEIAWMFTQPGQKLYDKYLAQAQALIETRFPGEEYEDLEIYTGVIHP